MISEKPLENYCHEVCLVFFYAQPLSSYCIISLGEAAQTIGRSRPNYSFP